MKKLLLLYTLILTAFTAYLVLDTFVIKRVYQTDTGQMNTDMFLESSEDTKDRPDVSDNHYRDETIAIDITVYEEYGTTIYVADITVTSAEYLKTAFAQDTYGKNITDKTSVIAADHNAILAVNGDFYGSQKSGYVIRNGIVYRDKGNGKDILCIFADGNLSIFNSDEYTADELADMGVWQALCFGPGLIEDGEITVNRRNRKALTDNPRTAIGMIEPCHYIFLVADGRSEDNEGLSLTELAEFMDSLGVTTAYNLDGGGSSTMVFQGSVINNPSTGGKRTGERSVSDIVYIG